MKFYKNNKMELVMNKSTKTVATTFLEEVQQQVQIKPLPKVAILD